MMRSSVVLPQPEGPSAVGDMQLDAIQCDHRAESLSHLVDDDFSHR
jgi:hypothetical protein